MQFILGFRQLFRFVLADFSLKVECQNGQQKSWNNSQQTRSEML